MADDEELEKLREQRKREMSEQEERQDEAREQQKAMLWQKAKDYMTEGAAERLSNIKTVDEQKAFSVAQQIVALGRNGRVDKVDEDQMKQILREIQKDREEDQANIKFRR